MPSLTPNFSSADEFSPLQPIFPNLSTSEEMSLLIARIAELNRANTVEPSIPCYFDLFGQDGNEVNADAISLDNNRQFDGKNSESIADQKQLKEFREKFARMEMELKMAKLEVENKEQKLKLQEMMGEQKALKEKVARIEQEKEKNAIADQLSKIMEKFSELEKQHENTTKATSDQLSKMQNDQKILMEKVSELEKEQKQKQRKALLNCKQNYWDANVCNENLEIIGEKSLTVHYKRNDCAGWCSVFAKHPILMDNNSSNIFYYEISIKNKKSWLIFGFAVKQQRELGFIFLKGGTYAYDNFGDHWINGKTKARRCSEHSYGVGDTVGIGVNSATRQIIFTKNGYRLDTSGFLVDPSFADDSLHPFLSLCLPNNKFEANFGPNFKFDLATL
ncbi:hypothetical protein niasHT_000730 [Heterodera trifolii]|uniref:B30.2/SPRY domain-containing protein n=1 Tax=Heterodera trifolii TaxID=157864 RepID=A0ABD2MFT5_9BILA